MVVVSKLELIMAVVNSGCLNDIVLVDRYPPPTAFLARYNSCFYVVASFAIADVSKAVSGRQRSHTHSDESEAVGYELRSPALLRGLNVEAAI